MDPANPTQADASQAPQIDPTIWVDEYGDFLFRYANSRLRDPNAAEEVVQETFLAGVRYSAQFAGCLLYTSPSPRDKRQSRMPSSA